VSSGAKRTSKRKYSRWREIRRSRWRP